MAENIAYFHCWPPQRRPIAMKFCGHVQFAEICKKVVISFMKVTLFKSYQAKTRKKALFQKLK